MQDNYIWRVTPSQLLEHPRRLEDLHRLRLTEIHSDMTQLLAGIKDREILEDHVLILVALQGGYCIGWGAVEVYDGKALLMAFVDERYRNKGHGTALAQKLITLAPVLGNYELDWSSSGSVFWKKQLGMARNWTLRTAVPLIPSPNEPKW
jgi:GNAT superfamily N-acetyltransferase